MTQATGLVAVDGASALEQLRALRATLAYALDGCESLRDLGTLANRYLQTVEAIRRLEGSTPNPQSAVDRIAGRRARPGGYRAAKQ